MQGWGLQGGEKVAETSSFSPKELRRGAPQAVPPQSQIGFASGTGLRAGLSKSDGHYQAAPTEPRPEARVGVGRGDDLENLQKEHPGFKQGRDGKWEHNCACCVRSIVSNPATP